MPTKSELVAFASEQGVNVATSWTKAQIEAQLASAGYDPVTLTRKEDDSVSDITSTGPTGPAGSAGASGSQAASESGGERDPFEDGYSGTVPDEIENDAYTLQGQGEETAKREREQIAKLRSTRYYTTDE